ncbi:E3 ubiquitin-protein ligase [Hordeum vulgare]|nr:E3 ubiquitin-protein ligase [Hordeum vulgare]
MQLAAGCEGSPVATEAEMSTEEQRLAAEPLLHAPMKPEIAVHQAAGGTGAVVATDHGSRMEIAVKMDVTLLHCALCFSPLKPPVFQCKGGHVACGRCLAEPCAECGGAFDARNAAMDAVVSSTTVDCDHAGCGRYVTYHDLAGHRGECPHAPCACTAPGCAFAGPAPALLGHLTTLHSMPVHRVQYGKVLVLQVPASQEPRGLLLGDEDGRAFLIVGGALGPGAAVSAVCVRAEAMLWPRYTLKVWASGPAPAPNRKGKADTVMAEIEVTSSTAPGAVAVEELAYLAVPPKLLVGAGASRRMSLKIRIDKFTS